MSNPLRVLITGASGYLGSAVIKSAPSHWQIAATYLTGSITSDRIAAFQLDVRSSHDIDRLVEHVEPQVIIHLAALMQGDAMLAVNADGSRNIARAARRVSARLIHLSTDVIFDGEHAPYNELARPSPIFPYGHSKALAEEMISREHPHPVVVRTSLIYGFDPMDPRTRQTLEGGMPRLFTDEYRCPIVVDDLARALIELADHDFTGILHVAGPQRLSRYEFGMRLAHAFNRPPQFIPAPSASSPTPRPRDCSLNVSRAQTLLRTPVRGVDEVLSTFSHSST